MYSYTRHEYKKHKQQVLMSIWIPSPPNWKTWSMIRMNENKKHKNEKSRGEGEHNLMEVENNS